MNRKKKLLASAALTASLATGGAVGALFGTPTLSSAQTDPTTGEVRPAPHAEPEGPDQRAEGREGRRGRPGHHGHRRMGLEAAAEALGMAAEELKTELRSGKSVAEVAEARSVDLDNVIDAIVAAVTEHAEERATEFVNRKRPANAEDRRHRSGGTPPAAGTAA